MLLSLTPYIKISSNEVFQNKNAKIVELKNIMAATRNEEPTELAAQKRRANNLILHGR